VKVPSGVSLAMRSGELSARWRKLASLARTASLAARTPSWVCTRASTTGKSSGFVT